MSASQKDGKSRFTNIRGQLDHSMLTERHQRVLQPDAAGRGIAGAPRGAAVGRHVRENRSRVVHVAGDGSDQKESDQRHGVVEISGLVFVRPSTRAVDGVMEGCSLLVVDED